MDRLPDQAIPRILAHLNIKETHVCACISTEWKVQAKEKTVRIRREAEEKRSLLTEEERGKLDWDILKAAGYGVLEDVLALMECGANISPAAKVYDGGIRFLEDTPLSIAAYNNHLKIVKALLGCGASVETARLDGWTSLMAASEGGYYDVVQALLAAGASVEAATTDGWTSLICAAENGHSDVVQLLLAAGASVEPSTTDGRTSLMIAAKNGHLEVVQALLMRGANIDAATTDGQTPLSLARGNGHESVVRILKAAGDGIIPHLK